MAQQFNPAQGFELFEAGRNFAREATRRKSLLTASTAFGAGKYQEAAAALASEDPEAAMKMTQFGQGQDLRTAQVGAGQKLASGDVAGAAAGLAGAGDLQGWADLSGEQRQQASAQADYMGRLFIGAKQVPAEQRLQFVQQHLQAEGSQYGFDPSVATKLTPDMLTDQMIEAGIAKSMSVKDQIANGFKQAEIDETHRSHVANEGIDRAKVAAGNESAGPPLTDDATDLAAAQFSAYGTLPALGMGPAAGAQKKAIVERAAKLNKDLGITPTQAMVNRGDFGANLGSLKKMVTTMDAVAAYEDTTQRNLTLAEKALDGAGLGPSPVVNSVLQQFKKNVLGDPDVAIYVATLGGSLDEYTKVVAGTTGGSAPASDAARKSIDERLSHISTVAQAKAVFGQMRKEMKNRTLAQEDRIKTIRGRMLGDGGGDAGDKPVVKWGRDANGNPVRSQ